MNLKPQQIVVLGFVVTLGSAFVAASASLTVALVTSRAADARERAVAIREYRREMIKRPLEALENECREILDRLVAWQARRPLEALEANMNRKDVPIESVLDTHLDILSSEVFEAKRALNRAIIKGMDLEMELNKALINSASREFTLSATENQRITQTRSDIQKALDLLHMKVEEYVFLR